jgi:hypothetical protein
VQGGSQPNGLSTYSSIVTGETRATATDKELTNFLSVGQRLADVAATEIESPPLSAFSVMGLTPTERVHVAASLCSRIAIAGQTEGQLVESDPPTSVSDRRLVGVATVHPGLPKFMLELLAVRSSDPTDAARYDYWLPLPLGVLGCASTASLTGKARGYLVAEPYTPSDFSRSQGTLFNGTPPAYALKGAATDKQTGIIEYTYNMRVWNRGSSVRVADSRLVSGKSPQNHLWSAPGGSESILVPYHDALDLYIGMGATLAVTEAMALRARHTPHSAAQILGNRYTLPLASSAQLIGLTASLLSHTSYRLGIEQRLDSAEAMTLAYNTVHGGFTHALQVLHHRTGLHENWTNILSAIGLDDESGLLPFATLCQRGLQTLRDQAGSEIAARGSGL